MYFQRLAKQANENLQQIQQLVQGLYLDEEMIIQQFQFLKQNQPVLKDDFHAFEERTKRCLTQLIQVQKKAKDLQIQLQKEFGPEPSFPMELAKDTHFLK